MPLEIVRNDLTKMRADAIVNTANPNVAVGSGVDAAVYRAAGWDALLAERAKIGPMQPGEAAATPAFSLDAKYIIHTIGPAWEGGDNGEVDAVAACYRRSLALAKSLSCESIAFPLISTGTYGFPKDVALRTAVSEISGFLFENEMTVYLVVYDKESFEISGKAFSDIRSLIDERDVVERREAVYGSYSSGMNAAPPAAPSAAKWNAAPNAARPPLEKGKKRRSIASQIHDLASSLTSGRKEKDESEFYDYGEDYFEANLSGEDLDDVLRHRQETFQEYLFRLIDRKGLDDVEVYKKANIDRKHFSKIKSNVYYQPSKRTAVAFALALGLNMDETRDLLLRAGIALSNSSDFDLIVQYCIEHGIKDIMEINCILFKYNQQTLGA